MKDTQDDAYAERLQAESDLWWKRFLNVQAPYRWNLRRQRLGRTLDIGCGIGRNLGSLHPGSVGVDHNVESVAVARRRGYEAFTPKEWRKSELSIEGAFDSLLLAHVVEHMDEPAGRALIETYLPYLRAGGKVLFICPQERGFASDPTHVRFTDGEALERLARDVGLEPGRSFSFPFPRWAGKAFTYNEFCLVATKPAVVIGPSAKHPPGETPVRP